MVLKDELVFALQLFGKKLPGGGCMNQGSEDGGRHLVWHEGYSAGEVGRAREAAPSHVLGKGPGTELWPQEGGTEGTRKPHWGVVWTWTVFREL